jgi:hypothetical protein
LPLPVALEDSLKYLTTSALISDKKAILYPSITIEEIRFVLLLELAAR